MGSSKFESHDLISENENILSILLVFIFYAFLVNGLFLKKGGI